MTQLFGSLAVLTRCPDQAWISVHHYLHIVAAHPYHPLLAQLTMILLPDRTLRMSVSIMEPFQLEQGSFKVVPSGGAVQQRSIIIFGALSFWVQFVIIAIDKSV